jgi:uncharacterized protein (DUF433 family)
MAKASSGEVSRICPNVGVATGFATWGRPVNYAGQMEKRIEQRAMTPRYTISEAAVLVGRTSETVSRWSFGHERRYKDEPRRDEPLIPADGERGGLALSFLNLLELRTLSIYRGDAALQAIRRALEYVGTQLGEQRPLLTRQFHVYGGDLLTKFVETTDGAMLLNASRGGQLTAEKLVEGALWTKDIDYDEDESARRWWFKTRAVPLVVDTRVAGGKPITAATGVRLDAITSRYREGYSNDEIERDTGAREVEVVAAILLAA